MKTFSEHFSSFSRHSKFCPKLDSTFIYNVIREVFKQVRGGSDDLKLFTSANNKVTCVKYNKLSNTLVCREFDSFENLKNPNYLLPLYLLPHSASTLQNFLSILKKFNHFLDMPNPFGILNFKPSNPFKLDKFQNPIFKSKSFGNYCKWVVW